MFRPAVCLLRPCEVNSIAQGQRVACVQPWLCLLLWKVQVQCGYIHSSMHAFMSMCVCGVCSSVCVCSGQSLMIDHLLERWQGPVNSIWGTAARGTGSYPPPNIHVGVSLVHDLFFPSPLLYPTEAGLA